MGHVWQLQEAKNRLSEVVNDAERHGPQIITRRGEEVAVVMSYAEYTRLRQPATDLITFFQPSPLAGQDLDLARDRSPARPDQSL